MTRSRHEAFQIARRRLAEAGLETAALDARLLLLSVLKLSHEEWIVADDAAMTEAEESAFETLLLRRLLREPIAYILGQQEFFGRTFKVTPATLIPRPDTEVLIEAALGECAVKEAPLRILDLGTGTGAILLTLLAERPAATGVGVDISGDALRVAQENAEALGLAARAHFQEGNWTEGLEGPFDLVVSNPPYIPSSDISGLMADVRDFEPLGALDGGELGLDPLAMIAGDLTRLLRPDGLFLAEIGRGQEGQAQVILEAAGLRLANSRRDLADIVRVVAARAPYSAESVEN